MAGLLDLLTGGESQAATNEENQAAQDLAALQPPTVAQLSLPQLQSYVNAGLMTPAQMQAYIQQNNALATENTPQTGTDAQIAALNQLSQVANAGAAGTPVEQAQEAQAMEQANTNLAGQRGAIEQAAEARGTPGSLLQAALEQQNAGQDAQNLNQADLQAQAQAYQTALNAMSQGATVGQGLQGQQNTQANTVAAAQNAMQQFNAANQQAASANNAQFQQAANAYNTENAQNVANQNTGLKNTQIEYNAQVPQTQYEDTVQKATGQANQANQAAGVATGQGKQTAGLYAGALGSGATLLTPEIGPLMAGASLTGGTPSSGSVNSLPTTYGIGAPTEQGPQTGTYQADGGIIPNYDNGGVMPGQASFPGDSLLNDKKHIMVSPGEAVIPRTAVQQHPQDVLRLIASGQHPQNAQIGHDPQDVAALLMAMKHLRGGK